MPNRRRGFLFFCCIIKKRGKKGEAGQDNDDQKMYKKGMMSRSLQDSKKGSRCYRQASVLVTIILPCPKQMSVLNGFGGLHFDDLKK